MKIAFISSVFSNYMIKRYSALYNSYRDVYGIEVFNQSKYEIPGWRSGLDRKDLAITVICKEERNLVISREVRKKMIDVLNYIDPDVVAVMGWSDRSCLCALDWSVGSNKQIVLMSDSTERDEKRVYYKEWIKKQVVGCFSSALVAGMPQKEYVKKLGMNPKGIYTGYDAVDNEYFSSRAGLIRQNMGNYRKKCNLPEKYFLSSNRFIPKKNLFSLLEAYSQYRQQVREPWDFVLLGDGELMPDVKKKILKLKLSNNVILPGFKQYKDLSAYYTLAKCYIQASISEQWGLVVNEAMASGLPVLVSQRCGCQEDLVENGGNGFTFDPFNIDDICRKMIQVSSGVYDLEKMGQRSQEIISNWGCDNFAKNLFAASKCALNNPVKHSMFNKLLIKGLIHR